MTEWSNALYRIYSIQGSAWFSDGIADRERVALYYSKDECDDPLFLFRDLRLVRVRP